MEYYNFIGLFFSVFFAPYVLAAVFGSRKGCPWWLIILFAASVTVTCI